MLGKQASCIAAQQLSADGSSSYDLFVDLSWNARGDQRAAAASTRPSLVASGKAVTDWQRGQAPELGPAYPTLLDQNWLLTDDWHVSLLTLELPHRR